MKLLCTLLATAWVARGETTVVVVGAGIAGLTAARSLVDNWDAKTRGALSVTVLEGNDRAGGN